MDLDRLYEFILITEQHSITKAALLLGIAPATLHARLKKFESDLNVTLFTRSGETLVLTADGQSLYHNGKSIATAYRRLPERLKESSAVDYHRIRIGVAGGIIPPHLGPFLDIVNRNDPEVEISISDDTQVSIEDDLRSGNVDVYFAPIMSHVNYEGIHKQSLSSPHITVMMPRSHPLSSRPSVSLPELSDSTFLWFPETKEPCLRDFQLQNLEASGIVYRTYDFNTSTSFLRFLVPVGKGLLFSPLFGAEAAPHCVLLPVQDIPYPASDCILYLKKPFRDETTHFINDFLKFAKESSHEHRPII
jgi:DNA-binding transcriptional LysR family regulator